MRWPWRRNQGVTIHAPWSWAVDLDDEAMRWARCRERELRRLALRRAAMEGRIAPGWRG